MCGSAGPTTMVAMITVTELHKRYGSHDAVAGLSFTVPDATVTGFLGPNGAGKSTTMRCILGLDRPTSGTVTFDGRDFPSLADKASTAGALIEADWFTPARSGRSHLRVLARGAGVPDRRVEECLEIVGLTSAAKKKVGGYSLGMKQRLGLAAALLGDPKHLILDEPVNGLDPEGVSWMRRTIRSLADEGRSILVSSHLLSEMQLTADRLVVIGRGRMIGEYTMSEFLAGGSRVLVETPERHTTAVLADRLRDAGFTAGFTVGDTTSDGPSTGGVELLVDVPEGGTDAEVRRAVAEIALAASVPVTGLRVESADLETRFLAATSGAQEYRTESAVTGRN